MGFISTGLIDLVPLVVHVAKLVVNSTEIAACQVLLSSAATDHHFVHLLVVLVRRVHVEGVRLVHFGDYLRTRLLRNGQRLLIAKSAANCVCQARCAHKGVELVRLTEVVAE